MRNQSTAPHQDRGSPVASAFRSKRCWGAALLGIALGGLFDGILLHQVLQWHHLLSLVGNESLQDIQTQVLADGLFHILMYAIACVGLWLLWSGAKAAFPAKSSTLLGMTILGFGLWQILDVVFFHWVLRIHRIRVDVDNPLAWDVGWMIVFGLPALFVAYWLLAKNQKGSSASAKGAAAALTGLMLAGASVSLAPPGGADATIVLFAGAVSPEQAFSSLAASGGEIVWVHESGRVAALQIGSEGSRIPLLRLGAILVSGAIAPCVARTQI